MLVKNTMCHDIRVHKEAFTLHQAGYEVHIVGTWEPGLKDIEVKKEYTIHRIPLASKSTFPVSFIRKTYNLIALLRDQFRFTRKAKALKADIYHAHDLDTLLAASMAKKSFRKKKPVKLVYDSHEIYYEQDPQQYWLKPIHKWFWYLIEKCLLPSTNMVLTPNISISDYFRKMHPSYPRPFHVLMNCAFKYSAPSKEYRRQLRHQLGIPMDKKVLIFHGILDRARGMIPLIQAMTLTHIDAYLFILGKSDRLDEFKRLASELNIENHIHFSDYVPLTEVHNYLFMADIGLIPYEDSCLNQHYCTPNKLFDFISVGLPIIASDLPELRNIIQIYDIGQLLPALEPASIAKAINTLVKSPALYERYKNNMIQTQADINWENEGAKLIQYYENMLYPNSKRHV